MSAYAGRARLESVRRGDRGLPAVRGAREPGRAGHDRAPGRAAQRPLRRRRRARAPPAAHRRLLALRDRAAPRRRPTPGLGHRPRLRRLPLRARRRRARRASTASAPATRPSSCRASGATGSRSGASTSSAPARAASTRTSTCAAAGRRSASPAGCAGETGLPGPTSLDLAGVRLGLTWGATVNGDFRSDARLDTTTGTHTLLEFTTGQGRGERVVNAFVFAGRVWWAHETDTGPQHEYRRWRISDREARAGSDPRRPAADALRSRRSRSRASTGRSRRSRRRRRLRDFRS